MALNDETARLIEQMGAGAHEIAAKVQQVSGTGSDDELLVTAICGPGNRLIDIEFDPRSRRLDTHVLKEKVIIAVQRAGEQAHQQLMEVISAFSADFGGHNSTDMSGLQQAMTDVQAKIAEQREKLEAEYSSLRSPS